MKSSLILAEALVPKGSNGAANASPALHLPGSGSSRRVEEGKGSMALTNSLLQGLRDLHHPSANSRVGVLLPLSPDTSAGVPKFLHCFGISCSPRSIFGEVGWVSASWPPMGQTDSAALRQLRRHPTWARLLADLEMGT